MVEEDEDQLHLSSDDETLHDREVLYKNIFIYVYIL